MASTRLSSSSLDLQFHFGNLQARARAKVLNEGTKVKLAELFPSVVPLSADFCPIKCSTLQGASSAIVEETIQTVCVSGLCSDFQYRSYCYIPGSNRWEEREHRICKKCEALGRIALQNHQYQIQIGELKRELATERLNVCLLRAEVARVQQREMEELRKRPPTPVIRRAGSWTASVLLGIFIGFMLLEYSTASDVKIDACTASPFSQECEKDGGPEWWHYWRYDSTFKGADADDVHVIEQFRAWLRHLWHSSDMTTKFWLFYAAIADWRFVSSVLVLVHWFWAVNVEGANVLPMLVTLCLAALSGIKVAALAVTPALDLISTISFWVTMVFYFPEPVAGMVVAIMLACVLSLVCLFMDDKSYSTLVRGQMAIVITVVFSYLMALLRVPDWVITTIVVSYRIWRVSTYFLAERVEIRGADGKVLEVRNAHPAWVLRTAKFLQSKFHQVRTSIAPTARVIPNGLVSVEAKDGLGTGFRVTNYIVTAKHVVGNEEMVRVVWGDLNVMTKVVHKHPVKDIAFLALPGEFQTLPTYKLAKVLQDGPVVVVSLEDGGVLSVAVTEGVLVADNVTYAVATRNGMSGSPVTNVDGRVMGVHQTNTGFTGGAVILRHDDLPATVKKGREAELLAKIEDLERKLQNPMTQSKAYSDEDIIELIRAAVGREMSILRHEMTFEQKKKGKTKRKFGHKPGVRRRRAWTEEEYRELLEKGFTRDQLRDMASEILNAEYDDTEDDVDEPYPEWDEVDENEINKEWFGDEWGDESWMNFYEKSKPTEVSDIAKAYTQKSAWAEMEPKPEEKVVMTLPIHLHDKYGLGAYVISQEDVKKLGKDLAAYQNDIDTIINATVVDSKWSGTVDPAKVIKDLNTLWYNLNHLMWENGILPFTQRKKAKPNPKNGRVGQKRGPKTKN